jgi:hypothetical protein
MSSISEMRDELNQNSLNCDFINNNVNKELKEIHINVIPSKKSINNSIKRSSIRTQSSYGLRKLTRINWAQRLNTRKSNNNLINSNNINDNKRKSIANLVNNDPKESSEESSEVRVIHSSNQMNGQQSQPSQQPSQQSSQQPSKHRNTYFEFLIQSNQSIVPSLSISNVTKILKQKPKNSTKNNIRKVSAQRTCKKLKITEKRRKLYSCGWDQCESKKCQNNISHHIKPIDS